ncbi:hypothetical protein MYX78_08100, partial [Acidobacteria bacterium AH-259-G07]|nr:hypothetical protein [Acidobacteria bacterium AH-259-G07]
ASYGLLALVALGYFVASLRYLRDPIGDILNRVAAETAAEEMSGEAGQMWPAQEALEAQGEFEHYEYHT